MFNQIPGPYKFVWHCDTSSVKIFYNEIFLGAVRLCNAGPDWLESVCQEEMYELLYSALIILSKHIRIGRLGTISGTPEDAFAKRYLIISSRWRRPGEITNLYKL